MTAKELFNLGVTAFRKGDLNQALKLYLAAIEVDPNYERPYGTIGQIYRENDRFYDAITWYQKATEICPTWKNPFYGIGLCYTELGRYEDAIIWFRKTIEIDPKFAQPYFSIGNVYGLENQFTVAIQWYQKAMEFDRDWELPYNGIGECFYQQAVDKKNAGQLEESIQLFTTAKWYYYEAIRKNNKFKIAYLHLSKLPFSAFSNQEIWGQPLFNRYIILETNEKFINRNLAMLIEHSLSYGSPMLAFNFNRSINSSWSKGLLLDNNFQTIVKITQPFRTQFSLWEVKREIPSISFSAEAILHFYLGNPIRSYQIFDNELVDTLQCPLSVMNQYYFALSAIEIMEDHDSALQHYALPLAKKNLETTSNANKIDRYYSSLILDLAGFYEEAINSLEILKDQGFLPATYKLAELIVRGYETEEQLKKNVIVEFANNRYLTLDYFNHPTKIILDENEELLLKNLMPLLHFMECKEFLENIYNYHQRTLIKTIDHTIYEDFFFANHIIFSHLEPDRYYNYITKNFKVEAEIIYGNNEERELINPKISYYKEIKRIGKFSFKLLGVEIGKYVFTDYEYIFKKYNDAPDKANLKHYLVLVSNLQKEGVGLATKSGQMVKLR